MNYFYSVQTWDFLTQWMNLDNLDCRTFTITASGTKVKAISSELNVENMFFYFCVGVWTRAWFTFEIKKSYIKFMVTRLILPWKCLNTKLKKILTISLYQSTKWRNRFIKWVQSLPRIFQVDALERHRVGIKLRN